MIASFVGLIAVILGHYHHIVSVLICTLMMMACGAEDDNQSKSE